MPRRLLAAGCTLAVSCAIAYGATAGGSGSYARADQRSAAAKHEASVLRHQIRVERARHQRELRRLTHVIRHVYGTDTLVQSALTLASITYGVDRSRMAAVTFRESRWRPWATNPSGACGLAQFMPGTWASTPQGRAGMSCLDPLASALAMGWVVSHRGWGDWALTAY